MSWAYVCELYISSCVGGDAATVVGAFAHKPHHTVAGIGNDQLAPLLNEIALAVGEVVAYELAAAHAKGREAVALAHSAQGEG